MPNLKRRTKSGYRRNAIGTARPFLMGLEHPMILPNQQFEMQAFTEVSGIPQEKTDATTFTMPSDTDGFELDEITTAYGGFQSQTATLTEYMDERQNTPYLAGVRRDLPVALLLPQGKNRLLSDKDDFESAILVEHGFITSDTQDDNFNTSDGDVANPNKISVNYAFHGRHRHIFKPVDLNAGEIGSDWSASKPITGVAVLEEREDGGAKSRQFFAIEANNTASVASKLWRRDKYKNWSDVRTFGATTQATTHTYTKLAVAGGSLITLHGTHAATGDSGHYVFSLNDIDDATAEATFVTSTLWGTTTFPEDIYVKSPTEIFFVGGDNTATGVAKILKSSGALETPVQKGTNGALTSSYHAIHGRGEQLVVGGGLATSAATQRTATSGQILLFSNDSGETWTTLTPPSGIVGVITAVYMIATDAFWIATAGGNLRFTYDRGKTWINKDSAMSSVGIKNINVLQFVEPSGADRSSFIGYVAGDTSTTNAGTGTLRVARTLDSGATWSRGGSYIATEVPSGTANASTSWLDLALADAQSFILAGDKADAAVATVVEYE